MPGRPPTPIRRTRERGDPRERPKGVAGYSQGDRAIGQRVRGQDLSELQAAAHHLALRAGCPAAAPGPSVVLTAGGERQGPALSSPEQGEQREGQQQRLHAASRACGSSGDAGLAGGRVGLARRPHELPGGPTIGPARKRHAPLSAEAARPPPSRGVRAAGSLLAARPAGAPPPPGRLLPARPLLPRRPARSPGRWPIRPRPGARP